MSIRKKNAFAARDKKYGRVDSYEHPGQITILGRPNSKVQKDFDKAVKENTGNVQYNAGLNPDKSKLQTTNYAEDYWEGGGLQRKLEDLGYKVRTNKYGKPTSIRNPKDGSNYKVSYGGRDANGKPIKMSKDGQGFDSKKSSRISGLVAG